jgi:hypothetical protein
MIGKVVIIDPYQDPEADTGHQCDDFLARNDLRANKHKWHGIATTI